MSTWYEAGLSWQSPQFRPGKMTANTPRSYHNNLYAHSQFISYAEQNKGLSKTTLRNSQIKREVPGFVQNIQRVFGASRPNCSSEVCPIHIDARSPFVSSLPLLQTGI